MRITNHRIVRQRRFLTIAEENALPGDASGWSISGAGDTANVGFARTMSVQVGSTVQFSCSGTGTVLDIYRIGWYGGAGWRKVATVTNTATTQAAPTTISSTNGGTTCTGWSVTASWDVPETATSGLYVGVYRNSGLTNASWIPFVVEDAARVADVVVKTSDSTWLAYNAYNSGRDFYGQNYDYVLDNRAHATSYHKPIITRQNKAASYWMNAEAPLIRWLERNGYSVKYVSSWGLDQNPSCIDNASVFISSGHDEYWSQAMRDKVVARRDAGMHLLFMSGNEVFWRTRMPDAAELRCYKDTMSGPAGHTSGVALDPVTWTGTWKDTRSANNATRAAENTLTGQDFRMNDRGTTDFSVTFQGAAGYASHPFWRNTSVASGSDVTVGQIVGFEADEMLPTRTGSVTLASQTYSINGFRADSDGANYTGNGSLNWGVVSQRWPSGATVVGFGTVQWAWGLDDTHDRGSAVANTTMRQATYNLLRDLGAKPDTPQSGLTLSDPQALSNYGSTA